MFLSYNHLHDKIVAHFYSARGLNVTSCIHVGWYPNHNLHFDPPTVAVISFPPALQLSRSNSAYIFMQDALAIPTKFAVMWTARRNNLGTLINPPRHFSQPPLRFLLRRHHTIKADA